MNDKICFSIYFRTQRRLVQNVKVSHFNHLRSRRTALVNIIDFLIRSNAMRDTEDELNNLTYIDDDWDEWRKKSVESFRLFVTLHLDILPQRVLPVKTPGLEICSSPLLVSIVIFFLSHRLQWDWNKVKFNTKLWLKF